MPKFSQNNSTLQLKIQLNYNTRIFNLIAVLINKSFVSFKQSVFFNIKEFRDTYLVNKKRVMFGLPIKLFFGYQHIFTQKCNT